MEFRIKDKVQTTVKSLMGETVVIGIIKDIEILNKHESLITLDNGYKYSSLDLTLVEGSNILNREFNFPNLKEAKKDKNIKVIFRQQNYTFKNNDSIFGMVGQRDLKDLFDREFIGPKIILNYPEQWISMKLQWLVMPLIYSHPTIKEAIIKTESPMIIGSTFAEDLFGVTGEIDEDVFMELGLHGLVQLDKDNCLNNIMTPNENIKEFIERL